MMTRARALAAASAALLVLASASGAQAAPPWDGPMTLAEGLTTPLHLAVGPFGSVTVSEGVASRLTTVALAETRTVYEALAQVNAQTGAYELYVDGLITPTGIALDWAGNLYIASLFGPGIFKVPAGGDSAGLFLEVEGSADVEVSGSTLYATTGAFGNGTLILQPL